MPSAQEIRDAITELMEATRLVRESLDVGEHGLNKWWDLFMHQIKESNLPVRISERPKAVWAVTGLSEFMATKGCVLFVHEGEIPEEAQIHHIMSSFIAAAILQGDEPEMSIVEVCISPDATSLFLRRCRFDRCDKEYRIYNLALDYFLAVARVAESFLDTVKGIARCMKSAAQRVRT